MSPLPPTPPQRPNACFMTGFPKTNRLWFIAGQRGDTNPEDGGG